MHAFLPYVRMLTDFDDYFFSSIYELLNNFLHDNGSMMVTNKDLSSIFKILDIF